MALAYKRRFRGCYSLIFVSSATHYASLDSEEAAVETSALQAEDYLRKPVVFAAFSYPCLLRYPAIISFYIASCLTAFPAKLRSAKETAM